MRSRKVRFPILLLAVASVQGCVYVPSTVEVYDSDCQIVSRRMVLTLEQLSSLHNCNDEGCIADLVGTGIVASASLVVSGSIVIAGNAIYWLEKQGRCRKAD